MGAPPGEETRQAGMIVREREPVNLEYPFDQLDTFLTPNHLFYIRSHFKAPKIDGRAHRLRIEGDVQNPFEIGLSDLEQMPSITRVATLECAGNSRVFLIPQVDGAQWQLGAVSTAEWTGVPLSALLERARMAAGVCEVVFEAADKGTPKEPPVPPGDVSYARSLPIEKAAEVLIAYRMNGEEIPVDHGYPLRAIVYGHYGMASVKWLAGVRVVKERFAGYWQTSEYAYWDDSDGLPVRRALGEMAIKSAIARPRMRELVPAGGRYEVFGAAWSGGSGVTAVEVSTDGGRCWSSAQLLDRAEPGLWRRWQFMWQVPSEKGVHTLISRATDARGSRQPEEHDERFGSYAIHHAIAIDVVAA